MTSHTGLEWQSHKSKRRSRERYRGAGRGRLLGTGMVNSIGSLTYWFQSIFRTNPRHCPDVVQIFCGSYITGPASSPGLHALCERTELPARGLEPSAIARGLAKNDKNLPDLGEKLPDFASGKLAFF